MTTCMYTTSIPVLQQMLGSLDAILTKAEKHVAEKKIEPTALTQLRLFPDMFPLSRQVQIACYFARGIGTELTGAELPKSEQEADTFAGMHALIAHTLSAVGVLTPAQFDGSEKREVAVHPGTPYEAHFNGEQYLLHYAMPQFFFHVTTVYALLRHAGLDIGKRDFVGSF